MKLAKTLISFGFCFFGLSNAFAQDFNLECSKYYSGSGTTTKYYVTVSKDRASGFFIYSNNEAYKLNLIDKDESSYNFKTSNYATTGGGKSFLGFSDVSINRQNLRVQTKVIGRNEGIDCSKTEFNVMALVEEIKTKGLDALKREAADGEARKAGLRDSAKF